MRAKFHSDIALENFVDEAAYFDEVDVEKSEGSREVVIRGCDYLISEITALVHINGGDVLRETDE